jgi:hypothetical protein
MTNRKMATGSVCVCRKYKVHVEEPGERKDLEDLGLDGRTVIRWSLSQQSEEEHSPLTF